MEHTSEMGAHPHRSAMSSAWLRADSASLEAHRTFMMDWVDMNQNSPDGRVMAPPVSMILHRDLLEKAWGWERLLPDILGTVDWHDFKKYVEDYLQVNADKVAAGEDALRNAAKLCIETEKWLIRSCGRHLSFEDLSLSTQIQNRARDLIQSDAEYPAAAAALLSITKEAELMHFFLDRDFEISKTSILSRKVRRSASNLMLYKGSDSAAAAAAGAMVGVAKEAQMILDIEHCGSTSQYSDYLASHAMRLRIATALVKLEEELACAGTGCCLDSEGSGSMAKSGEKIDSQDSEKENEKMNKNLNNQTSSAEEAGGDKEVKVAGEKNLKDIENGTEGEAFSRGKEDTSDT